MRRTPEIQIHGSSQSPNIPLARGPQGHGGVQSARGEVSWGGGDTGALDVPASGEDQNFISIKVRGFYLFVADVSVSISLWLTSLSLPIQNHLSRVIALKKHIPPTH